MKLVIFNFYRATAYCKNTAVVAIIGLCIQQLLAAVLTGWSTRRTVIDRNISVELECYFIVISQFFSRTSCVFECWYLTANGASLRI